MVVEYSERLVRFLRHHKVDRCATIVELNADIWHLVETIRKQHRNRELLIHQIKEFSSLSFEKLALESSLGMVSSFGNVDAQVIKALLHRAKAVARYVDTEPFEFMQSSPLLLSPKAVGAEKTAKCRMFHIQHIHLSRKRAQADLVGLQAENLRLNRSNFGIKQLLSRLEEDTALLRHDVKLLRQTPPALDAAQSRETWENLACMELSFLSEAEKRRSIASQRCMSALSARRLSMTHNTRPAASLEMGPGLSRRCDVSDAVCSPESELYPSSAEQGSSRLGRLPYEALRSEPCRYRYSRQPPNSESLALGSNICGSVSDINAQIQKRISMLSIEKRSNATISDSKWSDDVSDDDLHNENNLSSAIVSGNVAADNADFKTASTSSVDASLSTTSSSSLYKFVDSQAYSIQRETVNSTCTSAFYRQRSFVVPRKRYSTYDEYGRKLTHPDSGIMESKNLQFKT